MATLSSELVLSLIDKVTAPARNIANSIAGIPQAVGDADIQASFGDRLAAGMERNNRALDEARGGMVDAVAGFYALKAAMMGPVTAASEFESAMADVKKVVDFPTPEAFDQFTDDLKAMSREIPTAIDGLAAIAASAGEAGFAGDELLKVTEAASKIGVAFGISAEEAGDAIPQLMNSMSLTLDETILLADGINHLSNNMAASADKVLNFQTRVGASGKMAGFSEEQTAAFGATMIAAGADADVAATSFRNMAQRLGRGEAATKAQIAVFEQLGLSATQVAEDMQEDAVGTTLDVLRRLGEMPAHLRVSMSEQLFGNEARALAPIISDTEALREALSLVGEDAVYAGSAFREFEVRSETFGAAMTRAKNTLSTLAIAVGESLLPIIEELATRLTPVVVAMAEFADNNQTLVGTVAAAAGALVAFKVATAGLRFVGLLGRGGALSMLSAGFKGVAAAAKLAGGMSLLLTPALTPLIVAVGAVAGAGVLIYRNWETVSAVLRGVGSAIRDRMGPAFEYLEPVIEFFGEKLAAAKRALSGFWELISGGGIGSVLGQVDISDDEAAGLEAKAADVAGRIIDALTFGPSLFTVWREGWGLLSGWLGDRPADAVRALSGLTEAMSRIGTEAVTALWNAIKAGWSDATGWLGRQASRLNPFSGGGEDEEPEGRAVGGPVRAGQTYEVGESGREFITPSQDGWVTSNAEIVRGLRERAEAAKAAMESAKGSAQQAGGSRTVNLGGVTMNITAQPGQSAREIAEEVMGRLTDQIGSALDGAYSDPA